MAEPNNGQPLTPWNRLLLRIRQRFGGNTQNASETRIRRRRAMVSFITRRLTVLKLALLCAGYFWMIIIPSPRLGRSTYIDENALQPGQVTTYWNWGDVHTADRYLEKLEVLRDTNATGEQRAQFIEDELRRLGIPSSTQNYSFSAGTGDSRGINAYGVLSSPRTSGNEAMVISASWLSRTAEGDGTLNLRGIATILALANFLKRYSLWAKDIIFVVSDGYLEGMHAWLARYHGSAQSNLRADRLVLSSGVIWSAFHIDYPGHSFSHLGIFFEGMNGRLPNQDLVNSFQRISSRYTGVPVVLYDHIDDRDQPYSSYLLAWLPAFIREETEVQAYVSNAKNVIQQSAYQALGRPSGVHGLYHQFHIDAFTMFAVPATGPHGFHAIGRVIESTLRTTNNLLERLHASFFFYIMTGPERFLKIGSYLPSAILISVSMMFTGLQLWVDAGWTSSNFVAKNGQSKLRWLKRPRPVMRILCIMLATHLLGALLFGLITMPWFIQSPKVASPLVFTTFALIPLLALSIPSHSPTDSLSPVLKAINLCFASTVISIITVLNFPLAALLAILLGLPLSLSSPSGPISLKLIKYCGYVLLGLGWLLFSQEATIKAIRDWEILSIWFTPFVCFVYVPLTLQSAIVCLLPP